MLERRTSRRRRTQEKPSSLLLPRYTLRPAPFGPRRASRATQSQPSHHPAPLSFRRLSCANAHQYPHKSLDNPDSAQALVKSTNLLSFCTCIHRFNGRTVTSTDEPCRASGVGRRNGWWNEQPMRIGKSPPAQPEGETWSESSRGIAGSVRRCKSRCKPKVV